MKALNTFIFVLLSLNIGTACDCILSAPLTADALKEYKSIALIKVIKVVEPYKKTKEKNFLGYKIKVKTIEHYKGDTLTELIVDGGHPKFKTWTSCDLGINEGQELFVFTRSFEQNLNRITFCDRNLPHRSSNGLRYWEYPSIFKIVAFLDSIYQKPEKFVKKGKHEEFYENGQKEIEEVYENGQLSGLKKIWYPDGRILSEMIYEKGKLKGGTKWYYAKGKLIKTCEFDKDGKEINVKNY